MSTKIYDAYITKAPLHKIMRALQSMRKEVRVKWRERVRAYVLTAGKVMSAQDVTVNEYPRCDLRYAIHACDNIMKGYRAENPVCSAVVYAPSAAYAHKVIGESLIVQFFGAERDLEELLKKTVRSFGGRDYHYQNQCDQPSDVTEEEWNDREKVWDSVLPGSGIPSENGLSFDLINKKEAVQIVWEEFCREYPPAHAVNWGENEVRGAGMFRADDFIRAWRAGVARHTLQRFEDEIRARFNPVVDSLDSAAL